VHIFTNNNCDLAAQEFQKDIKKFKTMENNTSLAKNLTESYLAGICLLDLTNNRQWKQRVFNKPENVNLISFAFKK
jgi:hypothetical protein